MINPRTSAFWITTKAIAPFSCTPYVQEVHTKAEVVHLTSFTALAHTRLSKNLATVNGGALALAGGSVMNIMTPLSLTFVENVAISFGGAMYIEDSSAHCSYDWNDGIFLRFYLSSDILYPSSETVLRYLSSMNTGLFDFSGNSAMAGSVIYGGDIDNAELHVQLVFTGTDHDCMFTYNNYEYKDNNIYCYAEFGYTVGQVLFSSITEVNTNNGSIISSNPNRICKCINGQPDCSDPPSPYEVGVYPGQTVGVSLVAVGQRNGTVPSATTAVYDPDDGATFGDLQSTQRIDHTTCTEFNYTIISRKLTETFKIYVDSSCGSEGIPLSVNVTLLKCPIGFTLSNSSNQCVCEERLQKYTSRCDISNLEITRTASDDFWVGVDNTNGTEGLILHPHCPFDYCITDTVNFTLNDVSRAQHRGLMRTRKLIQGPGMIFCEMKHILWLLLWCLLKEVKTPVDRWIYIHYYILSSSLIL